MIDYITSLFWQVILLFGGMSMIHFGYKGEVPVEGVSNAKKPLSNDERTGMFVLGVFALLLGLFYLRNVV